MKGPIFSSAPSPASLLHKILTLPTWNRAKLSSTRNVGGMRLCVAVDIVAGAVVWRPPTRHPPTAPGLVSPCSYASLQYVYYTALFRVVAKLLPTAAATNARSTRTSSTWCFLQFATTSFPKASSIFNSWILFLVRPPLSSSGQSSWLQIQRSGFDSRRYRFTEKQWVWNGVYSASWVQLRIYLKVKVADPV
jgi:hypothetical protein